MKFQELYKSIIKRLQEGKDENESDYESTLSTLNKDEFEKFMKKAELPYNSIDYNTFGDILIKTPDPHKVYDILIGVEDLEAYNVTNKAEDDLIIVHAGEKSVTDDDAVL
jgi:hypothetical protein